MAAVSLTTRLATRLIRRRVCQGPGALTSVGAAFVALAYVALFSVSLSPAQTVDRDLGRAEYYAGFGAIQLSPGDSGPAARLGRQLDKLHPSYANVTLVCPDFVVDGWPESITFVEGEWSTNPFPGRYTLTSGRWPRSPGEVVIIDGPERPPMTLGRRSVLSGLSGMNVVGTGQDHLATSMEVLAAPGSWARLPAQADHRFESLSASVVTYWSGVKPSRVLGLLDSAARRTRPGEGPRAIAASVRSSFADRGVVSASADENWLAQSPFTYGIPSLILPSGCLLLALGVSRRTRQRISGQLAAQGLSTSMSFWATMLPLAFFSLAWSLAGLAVGALMGRFAAHVASAAAGEDLAPFPSMLEPGVRVLVGLLVTMVAIGIAHRLRSALTRHRRRTISRPRLRRIARDGRHLIALGLVCYAAVVVSGTEDSTDAMLISSVVFASAVLMVPEMVALALLLIPTRSSYMRVAVRHLRQESGRVKTSIGLLLATGALAVGFLILFTTMIVTAGLQEKTPALPGQIVVTNRSSPSLPAPESTVTMLASGPLRGYAPIQTWYAYRPQDRSRFALAPPRALKPLVAVRGTRDATGLMGRRLTPSETRALMSGDMLMWNGDAGDGDVLRFPALHGARTKRPVAVSRVSVSPSEWNAGVSGLVLQATVRRRGYALTPGTVVFPGVTAADVRTTRRSVVRRGTDPATVWTYAEPPPPVPPLALTLSAVGLAALLMAMVVGLTRGSLSSLRRYAVRLDAIGIPRSWFRRVVLVELAVILGTGLAGAALLGFLPSLISAAVLPHYVFAVPWGQLGLLLAVLVLASVLTTVRATLSIGRHR